MTTNNAHLLSQGKALRFADLSQDGQLRLLDLAFKPFVLAITTVPFFAFPFVVWAYLLGANTHFMLVWGCFYMGLALAVHKLYSDYKKNRHQNSYAQIISKWIPIINGVALTHGVGMTLPFVILMDKVTFEYNIICLHAIGVGNFAFAAHLSPLPKTFYYTFIPCVSIIMLLLPWSFPNQWLILFFFCIVYSVFITEFARVLHQFFLRQIVLEEESLKLSENYRMAKVEAEASLQSKNQFLTTASHDLRQPVHAMGFLIESIAHRNQDPQMVPALKDLKQSVHTVTQMFGSLLDLSKIESGKVKIQMGHVYLDELLRKIAALFAEEARARNLELRVRICGESPTTQADGQLLHQSIMNLMHNALRYTKKGGILLSVRKRNAAWQIEVWDTGIGVALDDQDKIYSPFFRNEHAWRIDSAGHGLGLSVVARCCELMGFQYGFTSKLSKGSRFWLRLPQVSGQLKSMRIVNEVTKAESLEARISLTGACLIVDDDPQVTNAWHQLLSSWGVNVICAESGMQAIEILNAGFQPQAILCDQRLRAGESGFDVLKELLEICPTASGAMISGEFDSPELKIAENEGYLVLHKPLEPSVLHTVLSRWLTS